MERIPNSLLLNLTGPSSKSTMSAPTSTTRPPIWFLGSAPNHGTLRMSAFTAHLELVVVEGICEGRRQRPPRGRGPIAPGRPPCRARAGGGTRAFAGWSPGATTTSPRRRSRITRSGRKDADLLVQRCRGGRSRTSWSRRASTSVTCFDHGGANSTRVRGCLSTRPPCRHLSAPPC